MSNPSRGSISREGPSLPPSLADWCQPVLFPAPLLYPISQRLRTAHSPDPRHIGVSGDPRLCRACAYLFSQPFVIEQGGPMTTLNVKRLRSSAKLGCYLCAIIYNAEWDGYVLSSSGISMRMRINHYSPGAKSMTLGFATLRPSELTSTKYAAPQGVEAVLSGLFNFEARISVEQKWLRPFEPINIFRLPLVLVPERDVEEMEPTQVDAATSAQSAAALSINWIEHCQNNHGPSCHAEASATWRPTRLIHVSYHDAHCGARLCISSELPQEVRYTTLSHCWGNMKIFKLLLSNILSFRKSIPLDSLTQLFRDAIEFTHLIGIEYIWIDSLCIIQDSKEDWARESIMMGEVYKNGWCNIAGTGFLDGQAGLYVRRDPSILYPRKFNISIIENEHEANLGHRLGTKSTGKYYCMEDIIYSNITTSPLAQRAWVYQERLLSKKIIHFGSRQILWECNTLEACETFQKGVPRPLRKIFKARTQLKSVISLSSLSRGGFSSPIGGVIPPDISQNILDTWENIKQGYNDKSLTVYTDKVVAISGLVKQLQKFFPDEFVAGLWKRNLLQQLLWYCPYMEANQIRGRPRPLKYVAPSWSWLSVNVEVLDLTSSIPKPLASIIDYYIAHPSRDFQGASAEFDPITGGYIRICGRLMRAAFAGKGRRNNSQKFQLKLASASDSNLIAAISLLPDIYKPVGSFRSGASFSTPDALGSVFYLLPIGEAGTSRWGLVLRHTGVKGQYERLGLWLQIIRDTGDEAFKDLISHLPSLVELDYEELREQGRCVVKII